MKLYKLCFGGRDGEYGIEYTTLYGEKLIAAMWGFSVTEVELVQYIDGETLYHLHDDREFETKPLAVLVTPTDIDLPD